MPTVPPYRTCVVRIDADAFTVHYWYENGKWKACTEHRKVTVAGHSRFATCMLAVAAYYEWVDGRTLPQAVADVSL